jgi:hypothetical protein
MFEKVGRLAESAATKVSLSRRGFLGRLGQGALALTGVLGGFLVFPKDARAGGSYVCCKYKCYGYKGGYFRNVCLPPGSTCRPLPYGYCSFSGNFVSQKAVPSCTSCK